MTAKHTPGPWQRIWSTTEILGERGGEETGRIVGPGGWGTIAHLVMDDYVDANARLIAAAPDLLEACKAAANDAISGACRQSLHESRQWLMIIERRLRDAIAIATTAAGADPLASNPLGSSKPDDGHEYDYQGASARDEVGEDDED